MLALTPAQDSIVFALAADLMAAAASDADRARIDRALDLVGSVERTISPSVYLVRSASQPDCAYRVQNNCCNCPDAARRDARHCKHSYAVQLFNRLERAEVDADQDDAESTDDPDATRVELTGRGYLTLVPATGLPMAEGGCTRLPMDARCQSLADELFGPDPSAA